MDGVRDSFRADFSLSGRRKGYKSPPRSLFFASIVALIMSAMYLFKAFAYMSDAVGENDVGAMMISFGLVLLFFLMFVRFVIALFRLSSGSRKAWVTTVRMAITYLALAAVGQSGLFSISSDVRLGAVTIPWWIMAVIMSVLIVYMFLPKIRTFFTPAYAEPVGGWRWFLYLAGLDPFRKGRMSV